MGGYSPAKAAALFLSTITRADARDPVRYERGMAKLLGVTDLKTGR